ncbi:MAG: sigma-70 family RNA polymerase sigma factor [Kiloniellales bacterium]
MSDLLRAIEAEIPALRRYARALLRDSERADDLVQDCLERALSRLHLWRRPGNLRAWLFTIMHNVNANQRRASGRRPIPVALDAIPERGQAATQVTDVAAREVLEALERLSADQRQVLLLVAVEGLRYQEAAQVLGVPLGTVMSRLGRGRERLRELLDGEPALRRVK